MQDLPRTDGARLIRKSSYGRTELFIRDGKDTVFREIRCLGGTQRRETANVYHPLVDARNTDSACCWHCCEPVENGACVIPLPVLYDAVDHTYHVYGRTCSPGCAKAYVLEHTTFDRGHHLNVLTRMLREEYGITGAVVETPPRPALKRFGGYFDPSTIARVPCRTLHPPFVSYCMVLEEVGRVDSETVPHSQDLEDVRGGGSVMEVDDGLHEPHPPAAFDGFLDSRGGADMDGATSSTRTTARSTRTTAGHARVAQDEDGPITKFCKQGRSSTRE